MPGLWHRNLDHIPCLGDLPVAQRRMLYKEACREVRWQLAIVLAVFTASVSCLILFGLARGIFGSRWNPGIPWAVIAVLLGVPGLIAIHLIETWFDRHVVAPRIWRRLPDVCSGCGYSLTGNTSGGCPECGHHVEGFEGNPTNVAQERHWSR